MASDPQDRSRKKTLAVLPAGYGVDSASQMGEALAALNHPWHKRSFTELHQDLYRKETDHADL